MILLSNESELGVVAPHSEVPHADFLQTTKKSLPQNVRKDVLAVLDVACVPFNPETS